MILVIPIRVPIALLTKSHDPLSETVKNEAQLSLGLVVEARKLEL